MLSFLSQTYSVIEQIDDAQLFEYPDLPVNQRTTCSIFPTSDQAPAVTTPQADMPSQHTNVNADSSPLFELDIGTFPEPAQPRVDTTIIADLYNLSADPPIMDGEKANKLACLEALRQQRNHIQDCIRLL